MNGKNILITGGTGFLGSSLLKELQYKIKDSEDTHIIAVYPNLLSEELFEFNSIDRDRISFVQCDLSDSHRLNGIFNKYEIDTVIHLAAVSIVRKAIRNPSYTFETNIRGTWNLLEAARNSKTVKAFIGTSSDKAYGTHESLPYTEDMALQGLHTYDASKACEDILIRTYYKQYGLPTAVTRACNIYGPGDFNYSRIIPNSIRKVYRNESPVIWEGVHRYVREFIYVKDAVYAILRLIEGLEDSDERVLGEAFNLSTGDIWMVEPLIENICRLMNSDIRPKIVRKELEFLEIEKQWLSGEKLRALGWKPEYTVHDRGLQSTIAWHLKVLKKYDKSN